MHLPVIRAVVIRLAVLIVFEKLVREEVGPEETGIKRRLLFFRTSFHQHPEEEIVPYLVRSPAGLVKRSIMAQFLFQRQQSLVGADIRRSDLSLYHGALLKLHPGSASLPLMPTLPGPGRNKRLVKLDHKIVAEIGRRPTHIVHPAGNTMLLRKDLDSMILRIPIQHNIPIHPGRKAKSHMRPPFHRRHLRRDGIVKRKFIIVRLSRFIFVMKRRCPFILVNHKRIPYRHKTKDGIVADPWTALMSLAKTTDRAGAVLVFPAFAIFARLRTPGIHPKR